MFGTESSKRIIIAWILYIQDESKWFKNDSKLNFKDFEEFWRKIWKIEMLKQVLDIPNHLLKNSNF